MLRLELRDFEEPGHLAAIAAIAGMTPEEFRRQFGYLVGLQR